MLSYTEHATAQVSDMLSPNGEATSLCEKLISEHGDAQTSYGSSSSLMLI